MCSLGTVWTIPTTPQYAAKGALQDGVNVSVYENNSMWSVFSDPVIYVTRSWKRRHFPQNSVCELDRIA